MPSIVFACDTAPEMETMAPGAWSRSFPRRIDLENVERSRVSRRRTVVETLPELGAPEGPPAAGGPPRAPGPPAAGAASMPEHVALLTGRMAKARLEKVAALGPSATLERSPMRALRSRR